MSSTSNFPAGITSGGGRCKRAIVDKRWGRRLAAAVCLMSGTALAETPAAPKAGPDQSAATTPADAPSYGPQSPADLEAAAAAAAEEKARQADAEEKRARELSAVRADLDALRSELAAERAARAADEANWQARAEAMAAEARRAPPTVSTARLGLGLTGFLQADLMVRQSSQNQLSPAGAPLNQNEFYIRRARLRATVDRQWVAGLIELDGNTVNGPQARIIGAEASVKLPAQNGEPVPLLMATIRMFKIPFGFEVGQSDRERLFLERSTAERGLFPGEYDAGARLAGGWRFVRYALAAMDGEPIGEKSSYALRDPNSAKDFVGRVGIDTPLAPAVWVAGGFSGLGGKGFHPGTAATKSVLQWNDRNQNGAIDPGEIMVIPGASATPSQSFTRFGYGADLRVGVNEGNLGATVLYGELYWAKNLDRAVLPADPVAFSRDYREFGAYVGATQDLGPHVQLGARFDFYNPDADSVNQIMGATLPSALTYKTLAMVAGWRAPAGRLIAEFDLNRNHNGRDVLGNPTNLADNAFSVRGEVSF